MIDKEKFFSAAIISAIPIEISAIEFHVKKFHRDDKPDGSVYRFGFIDGEKCKWKLYIVESQSGQVLAGQEINTCLSNLKPNVILFIGVAGGDPEKTSVGDLVIPDFIFYFESAKISKDRYFPRFMTQSPSRRLMQAARYEARAKTWQNRIPTGRPNADVPVWFGPIASGDKVITSTTSHEWSAIKSHNDKCLAVEMEGFVFLLSSFHKDLPAIVIRGISDVIDDKNSQDVEHDTRQRIAAERAAAFGIELISNLNTEFLKISEEVDVKIHFRADVEIAMSALGDIKRSLDNIKVELIEIKPTHSFYMSIRTLTVGACLLRSSFYGGCLSEYLSVPVADVESDVKRTGDEEFDIALDSIERINSENDKKREDARAILREYIQRNKKFSRSILNLTGNTIYRIKDEEIIRVDSIVMNMGSRQVWRNMQLIYLSDQEFRCLEFLMRNPGIVLSRDRLEEAIWGQSGHVGRGALANIIRRLRKSLGAHGDDDIISTKRSHGYRLLRENH